MRQKTLHIDEQLDAYLDNELPRKQRRVVARHLKGCESCRRKWQEKRILSMQLRALPIQRCPERVVERVMQQARPQHRRERGRPALRISRSPAFAWRLAAGLAAAATLTLLLMFWPVEQKTSPPQHQYSPQEIAQAKLDVEQALGYLGAVLELTQQTIEQEVVPKQVVEPLKMGLHAAFGSLQKNGG